MSKIANEILSVGKIAQAVGATPLQVKTAIDQLNLKPSVVKGGCSYYGLESVEKIKSALNKV